MVRSLLRAPSPARGPHAASRDMSADIPVGPGERQQHRSSLLRTTRDLSVAPEKSSWTPLISTGGYNFISRAEDDTPYVNVWILDTDKQRIGRRGRKQVGRPAQSARTMSFGLPFRPTLDSAVQQLRPAI